MKITDRWLRARDACPEGREWFKNHHESDAILVLEALIADRKLGWASWLIVRVMNQNQRIAYAIYAAEQAIRIYKKVVPNDNRPREAITAAKEALKKTTTKKIKAAVIKGFLLPNALVFLQMLRRGSNYTARAAIYAAESAEAAVSTAATGNVVDAYDAYYSTVEAYVSHAWSIGDATTEGSYLAARSKITRRILKYGLNLLKETA